MKILSLIQAAISRKANPLEVPAFVSIVLDNFIRIQHLSKDITNTLVGSGLVISKDKYGYSGIAFEGDGDIYNNNNFIKSFVLLNKAGIAFSEDYKQLYSPAASMRELQKQGKIIESFTSIAWDGSGNWTTAIIQPES